MTAQPDIIVIGGGMAGISAGALLSEHAQVTVLEAEAHLGHHATGRSAAIFILNYGNATLRALNAAAFPVLSGQSGDDSVLSPRGEMLIARENELDLLDDYLASTRGLDRLTAQEARELVPILREDKIAAAVIERDAQDIDVDRLLQRYARQLRAHGGQILTGQPAQRITREKNTWRVQTRDHQFDAPLVVNAAGAWADEIASLAGVARMGLQPMRRSALLMAVPGGANSVRHWPLFGSVAERWYAKPDGSGLMISPADEDPVDPQDAWPDDMVLAEGLHRFEQMVRRCFSTSYFQYRFERR